MGRTLILAAHPDDEVVGLGGQLARFEDVHIVHVTDGAPADMRDAAANGFGTRAEYAQVRRCELFAALSLAKISVSRCRFLGVADQEASYEMPAIARRLRELFVRLAPDVVYTHPYEGGHPDHDATAFAAHCACRMIGADAPALGEFTSYHARGGRLRVYEFLPCAGRNEISSPLSRETAALKDRMLDAFATQRGTLLPFYACRAEKRRCAPDYDFCAPPHGGMLYYDMFEWGIHGAEWRARAARALAELGLS